MKVFTKIKKITITTIWCLITAVSVIIIITDREQSDLLPVCELKELKDSVFISLYNGKIQRAEYKNKQDYSFSLGYLTGYVQPGSILNYKGTHNKQNNSLDLGMADSAKQSQYKLFINGFNKGLTVKNIIFDPLPNRVSNKRIDLITIDQIMEMFTGNKKTDIFMKAVNDYYGPKKADDLLPRSDNYNKTENQTSSDEYLNSETQLVKNISFSDNRSELLKKTAELIQVDRLSTQIIKNHIKTKLQAKAANLFFSDKENKAKSIFKIIFADKFIKNIYGDEMSLICETEQNLIIPHQIIDEHLNRVIKTKESPWLDNVSSTEKIESYEDILSISFIETVDEIVKNHGPNASNWGIDKRGKFYNIIQKWFKHDSNRYSIKSIFQAINTQNKSIKLEHGVNQDIIMNEINVNHPENIKKYIFIPKK